MPGHDSIIFISTHASNSSSLPVSRDEAHRPFTCPHCGHQVNGAVIAYVVDQSVSWARCVHCGKGVVFNYDRISPNSLPGEPVEGLPSDVADAYAEARAVAGAGGHTSCELMCRKILMHVAVEKGAATNKSFAHYLDHLSSAGYVTPPMKPWVDQIRLNANEATHELPATDKDRALGTLAFTAQLLRLIYEMDHKIKQFLPAPPPASPATPIP